MSIEFEVNGTPQQIDSDPESALLYALRNELDLKAAKFGCGEGTCGSCMVIIDGEPVNSCDIPVSEVAGKTVTTLEGLADGPTVHAIQQAFIAEQAAQCGYCSSGMLMSACALLDRTPNPTDTEIRTALDDNLCRCGSHGRVLRAVRRAAEMQADTQIVTIGGGPVIETDHGSTDAGIGNDHIRVMPDGTVRMTSGKVDIGQGVTTAIAQIAADELDVSLERIRVVHTDTSFSPDDGVTAGSFSIQNGGTAMREAAQTLRGRLLSLATEDIGASVDDLAVTDGLISAPDGSQTSYWALAGGTDTLEISHRDETIGTSIQRWDLSRKFLGEPSFIQDLDLPDMLHGRVIRPPTPGATLVSLDPSSTEAIPEVVEVVRSGSFLGVVTTDEPTAIRAARRLAGEATWDEAPAPTVDPRDATYLESQESLEQVASDGDIGDSPTLTATYTRPFLAHASIGPSCALALWEGSELTVWTHSQGVFGLRTALGKALEMSEGSIRVIHMEGAGCYGHNGADDVAFDAVLLARQSPGRPVRLQWSREDEFAWEPYSSAMMIKLSASLDDDGKISEWSHDGWSHPHTTRPGKDGTIGLLAYTDLPDTEPEPLVGPIPMPPGGMLRNAVPPYDVGSLRVMGHLVQQSPVRTSALRGLGTHPNVFAIELFMDELAEATGADPVDFRLRHLSDERARAVIEAVVAEAGVPVGGQDDDGRGYGLGYSRYKNSACYVAVIAEVEAETEVRVPRMWAAVDAGQVINPDGVINQIEGGMIQSASLALIEQVKFEGSRTATRNWLDYPIMTFSQVPEIDVHLIDRPDEPSVGAGEGAAGPATAAIANALKAALGVPVRDLPFTADRVTKAILG